MQLIDLVAWLPTKWVEKHQYAGREQENAKMEECSWLYVLCVNIYVNPKYLNLTV